MTNRPFDIGMIGLGEMGTNLALNLSDHGFSVSGYDKSPDRVWETSHKTHSRIRAFSELALFTQSLKVPRTVILLVPAGPPVDAVLRDLRSWFIPGDLVIDGGNSHFRDTEARIRRLAESGISLIGMGISGGGTGARTGPSLMPGGDPEAYARIRPFLETVAARFNGDPCVAWLGPGSAGHYVKMVHNGIEYALMQLIAETYDLMKRGLGLSNDRLHSIYREWNESELESYLLGITSNIFLRKDDETGNELIDTILDEAGQKGTGKWTSQDAMDLGIPVPVIDAAVSMRELSGSKRERQIAGRILGEPDHAFTGESETFLKSLKNGFYCAATMAYAQGMNLLRGASGRYQYGFRLEEVTGIWRGGCIIRSAMLERIHSANLENPDLKDLLTDSELGKEILAREAGLRFVVRMAVSLGIPVPAMMASLAYFDGIRSAWLPANLIQAQRDYFGAHTYQRTDKEGSFHTEWESKDIIASQ